MPEPRRWPSFLRGSDASEILARVSSGDPLRLQEATARRLREAWVLLDPERACRRALEDRRSKRMTTAKPSPLSAGQGGS